MFQAFSQFDLATLNYFHEVYLQAGNFLTPFMSFVSIFAKSGLGMIAIAVLLVLFKRTRKMGISAVISVIIGVIIVNLILKKVIGRVRPYDANSQIAEWFNAMDLTRETDSSFPSGHVNITTIVMLTIFMWSKHKKVTWLCLLVIPIMAVSRMYLLYHYPTDVIASIIIGSIVAVLGYFITKLLYKKWLDVKDNKFTKFVKEASIVSLFREEDGKGNYLDEDENRDFMNDVNPQKKPTIIDKVKGLKAKKKQEQENKNDKEKE